MKGIILRSYIGIIISHYKVIIRIPINQPVQWNVIGNDPILIITYIFVIDFSCFFNMGGSTNQLQWTKENAPQCVFLRQSVFSLTEFFQTPMSPKDTNYYSPVLSS